MIVRSKPNLLGVLFSLKGSIAKRIALRSLLVTLLAAAIVLIETLHPAFFSKVNATPFTLLGLSLSIFMSFRNNACYDRWYEARKALGSIVTDVRSLIRETQVIGDTQERGAILRNLCGFAHALKARLRQEDDARRLEAFEARLGPALQEPFEDYVRWDLGIAPDPVQGPYDRLEHPADLRRAQDEMRDTYEREERERDQDERDR